jgi:hypothetical protein
LAAVGPTAATSESTEVAAVIPTSAAIVRARDTPSLRANERPWCVFAELAKAASAHTHYWNDGFFLGKLREIKIPFSD